MRQTFVNVNDKSFGFMNHREAAVYVMNIAIARAECMDLSTIKANICTACDLVSEMLLIKRDELDTTQTTGKTNLKRLSTKILNAKTYLLNINDKKKLLFVWCDIMMTVDEKPLLRGFGFGSKKFLGAEPGNAEKISVTRAAR